MKESQSFGDALSGHVVVCAAGSTGSVPSRMASFNGFGSRRKSATWWSGDGVSMAQEVMSAVVTDESG